jgi:hypothetical protein
VHGQARPLADDRGAEVRQAREDFGESLDPTSPWLAKHLVAGSSGDTRRCAPRASACWSPSLSGLVVERGNVEQLIGWNLI